MSFLQGLIELITVPPGGMIYHLVTLFAIQRILVMAFGYWRRNRRDWTAIRLLVVAAGFFLASILLMLVGGLERIGLLSSNLILPPLERFLTLATLLLTVWAFLSISARQPRVGMGLLIFSSMMCIFFGDFSYRMNNRFFSISREAFNVLLCSFLGLYKLLTIVFCLIPYVALLIVG